ncbi:unnamed protein product [Cyclocybe aegerita]|uniref:Uncharacterized protein n=1 Tax=Cyclocybe aegerita TaxID=1973307 RepID=A0A8S0X8H0_CYCAE|nr:unnamed protein product [Cyclocybe aegerita]
MDHSKDTSCLEVPKPSASRTECLMDGATLACGLLKHVGSISSVPVLSEATGIALQMLKLAQDVRGNRDALISLREDAYNLINATEIECRNIEKSGGEIPDRLNLHICHLLR